VCKIPRGSAKNHITSPTRTLGSITSRTLIRKRNWTNSTIILSWLSSPPPTWKTFITNRVPEIQTLTKPRTWFHVASKENPADIIWRGTSPDQLKDNTLWFNGSNYCYQTIMSGRLMDQYVSQTSHTKRKHHV
jgi:hypothetical protein